MGRTSVPHVYVIGDAKAKNIQLAHVASAQGENVVAVIAGKNPPLDRVRGAQLRLHRTREIASVGLTEEGAKAAGIPVKTGKYLTGADGHVPSLKGQRADMSSWSPTGPADGSWGRSWSAPGPLTWWVN